MGGNFKPNCALCIVDYLTRHGYITPDAGKIIIIFSRALLFKTGR